MSTFVRGVLMSEFEFVLKLQQNNLQNYTFSENKSFLDRLYSYVLIDGFFGFFAISNPCLSLSILRTSTIAAAFNF